MVFGPNLSRRAMLAGSAVSTFTAVGLAGQTASAADPISFVAPVSNKPWETVKDVTAAGWSQAKLAEMETKLYPLPTTSMMVLQGGEIVYHYGNISDVSYLASARKSILSMLFGRYVDEGKIDLNMTLGDVGIDEDDGLLPLEKTARIKDLLTSSSGVYHAAGSPGGNENTPERGKTEPGTVFLYNNWDFNVLGAIFEKRTGKTVFQALKEDMAEGGMLMGAGSALIPGGNDSLVLQGIPSGSPSAFLAYAVLLATIMVLLLIVPRFNVH